MERKSTARRRVAHVVIGVAIAALSTTASAQISLPPGATYEQEFDVLLQTGTTNAWTDNSTIASWYSNRTVYIGDPGTSNSGGLHSYGSTAERAMGSIGSGSANPVQYAVRFVNSGVNPITSVEVNYVGEQWRNGGAAAPITNRIDFQYQVAAAGVITDTNLPATGWLDANTLDFTGPIANVTAAALDGNNASNRVAITNTIAVTVGVGEELWLRWNDPDDVGSDHGLAIDELCVAANTSCNADLAPSVNSTVPADNAIDVALASDITVTFSEPVTLAAGAFTLSCADSGAHTFATSGGPTNWTLNPDIDFTGNELCTVTVVATQVTDVDVDDGADAMLADYVFDFTTVNLAPVIAAGDANVIEGDAGTATLTIPVTLTNAAAAFSVDYAVADGSATDADNDYEAAAGTLNFAGTDGEVQNIQITVNGDTAIETNETVAVTLSGITGGVVTFEAGGESATGTITNDDAQVRTIAQIQGSGAFSSFDPNPTDALAGDSVKVVGAIVTAVTQTPTADANGFYMQSANADADALQSTSEGIFVFTASAPTVAVGDVVTVLGQVQETFRQTQISNIVLVQTTGAVAVPAGLPTAVEFSAASGVPSTDPTALSCPGSGPGDGTFAEFNVDTNFECFEGMRIAMPDGIVTRSNLRRGVAVPHAEAFVMPTGLRARREQGVLYPSLPVAGLNAAAGQFDSNPELLEIDLDEAGLPGGELTAGSRFSATGVLGFSFGDYEFYPTSFNLTSAEVVPEAVLPTLRGDELTVASFNMLQLCEAAGTGSCSLAGAALTLKLQKLSDYVENVLGLPDVVGVQEVKTQAVLQQLAAQIQADSGVAYTAFLMDGNDPGGIDVGFLTRDDRITGEAIEQFFLSKTWNDPNGTDSLHDRPPLLLRATLLGASGNFDFAVLNNHLKARTCVDGNCGAASAERDRAKRFQQGVDVATLVQQFQTETGVFAGDGTQDVPLVLTGDFNAFEYTDGYVDLVGLIAGTYDDDANECNAVLSNGAGIETCNLGAGGNIVDPPLFNTGFSVPLDERISYLFTQDFGEVQGYGTNNPDRDVPAVQVIDHILLARTAQGSFLAADYGVANNAASDDTELAAAALPNAIGSSDHDGVIAYLDMTCSDNPLLDPDADAACGMVDNCPALNNPDQADANGDGVGTACNTAPSIDSTALTAATEGVLYSYAITASDAEDNEIALTAPTRPSWLTFTDNGDGTATLSGTPGDTDVTTHAVELEADDQEGTDAQTFDIVVTGVPDAPTIGDIGNQQTAEDQALQVNFSIDDVDSTLDCATSVSAGSSDTGLVPVAQIVFSGTAPNCTATITPAGNANGTATLTFTVTDGTSPASDSFVLTVTPVNDAPSFTLAAGDNVAEDSGARSVPGFASAISAGAANEAGQTLTFNLSGNTNPALFAVAPAISSNGTLTYTPAANVNGTATIDVTLSDNGGGTDTSAPQSFTITVGAGGDAPTFVDDPYAFTVTAGAGNGTVIGTVSATDIDAGDTLTYSIQTTSTPGAVTIDPATGLITVANGALITTSGSPILLTVRVVDSTNRADAANVTITVDPPLGIQIFADGFED